jgi:exopolyphosphatase/guanosine-5'-triphosphate,3'-diphosphate pyrophosphatase
MEPIRRAVIDVGTNSIKLLVAEIAGVEVQPVYETSRQTRLGRGFFQTHRLQPQAIAATAEAVAGFAAEAQAHGAGVIRVFATSAAREAANAEELTGAIERASGLRVEIISGEKEADWVFQGVMTDPQLAQEKVLLLDVGGGSTEFILGHARQQQFRASLPLGTVRMLENCPHGDPPTPDELTKCRQRLREFLDQHVRGRLEPALRSESGSDSSRNTVKLVGTGGTATILARMEQEMTGYDRGRIEATRIGLDRLRAQTERLWDLTLEARKQIVGLPPNRADVILSGVAIYEAVMDAFGFPELQVSTRGLRFAVVLENGGADKSRAEAAARSSPALRS